MAAGGIRVRGEVHAGPPPSRRVVLELLASTGIGILIALSLTAPPGPVNALIASHAVLRSWRAGFLVGMGAMTVDLGYLALSVLAHSLLLGARSLLPLIAFFGAAVMAYFAWGAARAWTKEPVVIAPTAGTQATSYVTGVVTNLTSPFPILWWLTAGIAFIDELGPAVLVGFFAGVVLWGAVFPLLLRVAQRRFAWTYHAVLVFSIVTLLAFSAYLVYAAVTGFP
jgi:threonine/homoserine/homoserine lactone efflux protein